jgi:hypothetical protein
MSSRTPASDRRERSAPPESQESLGVAKRQPGRSRSLGGARAAAAAPPAAAASSQLEGTVPSLKRPRAARASVEAGSAAVDSRHKVRRSSFCDDEGGCGGASTTAPDSAAAAAAAAAAADEDEDFSDAASSSADSAESGAGASGNGGGEQENVAAHDPHAFSRKLQATWGPMSKWAYAALVVPGIPLPSA